MIISISGKLGSGKDTVAKMIQDMQPENGWKVKKWAGKLKEMASILTGVPVRMWEDQEFKKKRMPEVWGMTYREFLQKLGTDAMRDGLHTNVWVNALMADYNPSEFYEEECFDNMGNDRIALRRKELSYPNWIITDTRFPNEAEAIRSHGYANIRVNRQGETGNHPSEIALDDYGRFDFIIDNNGSLQQLKENVAGILNSLPKTYKVLEHGKK